MVLKQLIPLFLCLFVLSIISACSPIKTKKTAPLVPAKQHSASEKTTEPTNPLYIFKAPTQKQTPSKPSTNTRATDTSQLESKETSDEDTNILQFLLNKAEKARNAQQWLRAQRVLEQAIRIEPKNPLIFMHYGDLYKKMGITDKAESMYKRALYLAENNPKVGSQISEKLEALEH